MKIKQGIEVDAFRATVDKCQGEVWLESPKGDKYNLKSTISHYLGLGKLLDDGGDYMELFCAVPKDQDYFFEFLAEHPEVR